MKKITILSNLIIGCFSAYFVWLPLSFALTWFFGGFPPILPSTMSFGFNSSHPHTMLEITNLSTFAHLEPQEILNNLAHAPVIWKTVSGFVGLFGLGLSMWMTFSIIHLFKRYSRTQIFDFRNVQLIRKTGWLFFGTQIFYIFARSLVTYLCTLNTKPVFAFTFGTHEAATLVLGLIVLVMSQIMFEANKMRKLLSLVQRS